MTNTHKLTAITKPFIPKYLFASPVGPWVECFSLLPTQLYNGEYIWLRKYHKKLMVVHSYLQHGGDTFWAKTNH